MHVQVIKIQLDAYLKEFSSEVSSSSPPPRGFTLMEVLLVLAILVILGSFVTVSATSSLQQNANQDAARGQIGMLEEAIGHYTLNIGRPPSDLTGLRIAPADLKNPAKWAGPYLGKDLPKDPWGNDYHYEVTDQQEGQFRIWSDGPDGQSGSDDDISNDPPKT